MSFFYLVIGTIQANEAVGNTNAMSFFDFAQNDNFHYSRNDNIISAICSTLYLELGFNFYFTHYLAPMNELEIKRYLDRINYHEIPKIDINAFTNLHAKHLFNIPFENLDIHTNTTISLKNELLFNKIVERKRGGFCYELNYLFHLLLSSSGFNSKIVSARIFDKDIPGPEYDHMAIIVELENDLWLADVGFGDLFIKPVNINNSEELIENSNRFKIISAENESYILQMSQDNLAFKKKYIFSLEEKFVEQFSTQCKWKQESAQSYFVQNKICTLPTENGRKTIFNSKFVQKVNGIKHERLIDSAQMENEILLNEFGIKL